MTSDPKTAPIQASARISFLDADGDEMLYEPDISHIVTEDDTPLDNTFSERQQHLLIETLYTTWKPPHDRHGNPRSFIALANVGLYYGIRLPVIVPDMMLSLGVSFPEKIWEKYNRSYFTWEYGKPPDLAVEIISNFKGNELDEKLERYADANVRFYLVFDPAEYYGSDKLRLFRQNGDGYKRVEETVIEELGLGFTLWEGEYKGMTATWLRLTDLAGVLLPTESEFREEAFDIAREAESRASEAESIAEQERTRASKAESIAEQERTRAEQERTRAEQERLRAERLAEKLRAMGLNPEEM